MRTSKFNLLKILLLFTVIISLIIIDKPAVPTFVDTKDECNELTYRLKSLEPELPMDIQQKSMEVIPLPSKIFSVSDVISKGRDIKLDYAYNNPNWVRPVYKTYWHSTFSDGRWSYVPYRIDYALHDIFTTYPTASIYYDFTHDLGIWDESKSFKIDNKTLETILLVVMDSNVKKIMTFGNQVVVIVEPTRQGLQVFEIPDNQINLTDNISPIMFQLVTPDGYEIDYSLIYKNQR